VVRFPEPRLARLYRAAVVPQTVVLNSEGRVLYARTGLLDSAAALDSVFRAATGAGRGEVPLLPARDTKVGPAGNAPSM
jgi:hypothetical protein